MRYDDDKRVLGQAEQPDQVDIVPDHDPETVRDAMQNGITVEQAEARQPDRVFTTTVNAVDEYNAAMDAVRTAPGAGRGVITKETIAEALTVLQRFRQGKANLENRITDNEEYYRLQHCGLERGRPRPDESGSTTRYRRNTAWLFTSISNKLADFMDNYPEASILPKEQSDETAAQQLTAILPVVLENNNFKKTYRHTALDMIKNGTGIQQIVWDKHLNNGIGDIAVRRIDPLNIFWEPGVEDIQRSSDIFTVELCGNKDIIAQYQDQIPDIKDHIGGAPNLSVTKYRYNESIDNSDKSYVVNWYYKRKSAEGRSILHYCRFVNDVVLFASENEPEYAGGWYEHGKYPFVFYTMYPEVGTPFGFGEIDIGRDSQEDIDDMNAEILRNTKQSLRRRYIIRDSAAINEQEYADYRNDFIHAAGNLDEINIREITTQPINAAYLEIYNNKINEQKEVTANRDVTQGGTGGTSTASGIAALQESGNKVSRDLIASSYESFADVCEQIIELIRQFYDIPRSFRIIAPNGQYEYAVMDNAALRSRTLNGGFGVAEYQTAEPVFDVKVKAFKQNPWSKATQNTDAINMYSMGFFAPENATAALACLEVMDVENKDKLKTIITQNGQQYALMQQMAQAAMMAQAVQQPEQPEQKQAAQAEKKGNSGNTVFEKAKAQAQAGTQPRT